MTFRIASKPFLSACLLGLVLGAGLTARPAHAADDRKVVKGMHDQIEFDQDVTRVAVGDAEMLSAEVLSSRKLLLLGLKTGRTSLMVWYADGTLKSFTVAVQPDLEVLRNALKEIHANIEAEMAPDREAVVLRGVVPDANYSRAAEAAAAAYLRAGRTGRAPLVRAGSADATSSEDVLRATDAPQNDGSVINLIRVDKLPLSLDARVREAIRSVGGEDVTVRRLVRGDSSDDTKDVLVLEGNVGTQSALTRVLHVASTLFLGQSKTGSEFRVTADEAGGLRSAGGRSKSSSSSSRGSSSSRSGSGSGRSSSLDLDNDIETNIGRAKVVSIADGRILSFIEVRDLPQVRIEVRVYEINRSELLNYAPTFNVLASDFDQGTLNPAPGAVGIQGTSAARVGGVGKEDVQNVLSFLADGLTEQAQVSGRHYAVDASLRILESRGIARSLSSPTLTVLSGETANFQVGGEVPVPTNFSPAFGGGQAADTTPGVFSSVEFREFGVELAVRALVGESGELTLDVFSQVDQPDETLTTVIRDTTGTEQSTTAFQTRSIQTTTRLRDGQSLMIGGLNSRSTGDDASYTPGIESIPIVGWLFKRFTVREDSRELLVVVNPTVVRERIDGLGLWSYPDMHVAIREYVDSVLGAVRDDDPPPASEGN